MAATNYHDIVSNYYDEDVALGFEERAGQNPLLEKIRNDFRRITVKYRFKNALEIGCGPGFDVAWFAREFPAARITGIDISAEMVRLASKRIEEAGLKNARVLQSDERQLFDHFSEGEFDLVYVYFGALNTVDDLREAALKINRLMAPGGHAVLTFVNKWYLREMIVQLIKMNFSNAFARLRKVWGGYSPERYLPSRCYSPGKVRKAFRELTLLEKQGYSIFFPAWYNFKKAMADPARLEQRWKLDKKVQRSCLWSKGEYTLFVFRKDA